MHEKIANVGEKLENFVFFTSFKEKVSYCNFIISKYIDVVIFFILSYFYFSLLNSFLKYKYINLSRITKTMTTFGLH